MWVRASGQLTENIHQISTSVSTHLLVWGDDAALIDTGISAVHNQVHTEILKYLPNFEALKYILLTHAHFDHLSGVPLLRELNPKLQLLVSPLTAQILADEDELKKFYQADQDCARAANVPLSMEFDQWAGLLRVDRIIGDGDSISLGDQVELKVISSPGHTEDSVSYFVLPDGALVVGDALGSYQGRDRCFPCFASSYQEYLSSIDRFAKLELKIISLAHSGALSGSLAANYLLSARTTAEKFYQTVADRFTQGELVSEIYQSILIEWKEQHIAPDGPFMQSQADILKQMIKVVAQDLSK